MLQEFERVAWYFRNAQQAFDQPRGDAASLSKKRGGSRPVLKGFSPTRTLRVAARLEQNLALAYEWQNKLDKAENHWSRYFDHLEQIASGLQMPPPLQKGGPGKYFRLPRQTCL